MKLLVIATALTFFAVTTFTIVHYIEIGVIAFA